MNNTFAFNSVEEFNAIFGFREVNGEKVRKNKIVLGFLRDYNVHKYLRDRWPSEARRLFRVCNVDDLYNRLTLDIANTTPGSSSFALLDRWYRSSAYALDEYLGICEDGDYRAIRYVNTSNGRIFKMKAGRFFKQIILSTELGKMLPESTILYLCEEFSRRWETYSMDKVSSRTLVVDDNFASIYDSRKCAGAFGSCMMDDDLYPFYNNAVKAKAASLRDENGTIVARCVIFTEVHEDGTDKIWRLGERQYACNELDKRLLVNALIRGGYIDGYKTVGASCHEGRNFVDNEGHSLSDKHFYIDCHLDCDDELSYQDSFKYYDMDSGIAWNNSDHHYTDTLDTTEGRLAGGNYDDYHNCYTRNDTVEVHYNGSWIRCDEERLDDFIYIDGEYYHEDEVSRCPYCDEYYVTENGCYSELTGDDYCCDHCRIEAELQYKAENWTYAEIDDEYFEDEDDVTTVFIWSSWRNTYLERSISVELLEERVNDGDFFEHEGEFYNTLEHIDALRRA